MLTLCLLWGMQQITIKVAAPHVAPVLQVAIRSAVSTLVVGLVAAAGRWRGWLPGVRGGGFVAGVAFALEFLFIAQGMRYTTAAHMAVFLYTAPLFAALVLHWRLPAERLAPAQWLGIGVAFVGIAVTLLGPDAGPPTGAAQDLDASTMLVGDVFGILAGAAWGMSTVAVRCTRLSEAPAMQSLFYQLLTSTVLLLPLAALTGQTHFAPGPIDWLCLAYQGLVVSFFSYLVWFWILRRYLASRVGVLSFMTPFFGVGLAAWLLHEPLEPRFLVGAALVLAGVFVVNGHVLLASWLRRATPDRGR